jgi:hypothetical protein
MSTFTDFAETTPQAAMANSRTGVQSQVNDWNETPKAAYRTVFNNWALPVLAGRADNPNPPQPPNAFAAGSFTFTDSTNSLARWAYPVADTEPASAMPEVSPSSQPYTAPVLPEPGNVRYLTAGDITPVAYRVNAADGGAWRKPASPAPFGIEYYCARIV